METLIKNIYDIIKDYRADEGDPSVLITEEHILNWVNQFEESVREKILIELERILSKRYISKTKVKIFLRDKINQLAKDLEGISSSQDFLLNTTFLDLQKPGKSQTELLKILDEVLIEDFQMNRNDCGKKSKTFSIYIDDVLCTGSTLINNLSDWSNDRFNEEMTNKEAVDKEKTGLALFYLSVYLKNYYKKKAQMKHKISNTLAYGHILESLFELENHIEIKKPLDIFLPIEKDQPKFVFDYKKQIEDDVKKFEEYNYPDEFFRPENIPTKEDLFSNKENRILVENAFLHKGIEILRNVKSIRFQNMRALGYSLPSFKNFGFGAMTFTWRNVPNNTPLVFWYHGGGFNPLFKVKRSSNEIIIESE